ncbi:MAG TPA: hypothetical protein VMV73_03090 [Candidatus Dormibacteraeota bacterium]|nr:hypothetical protein [Candidatus Dormibacteraeota bacterium]
MTANTFSAVENPGQSVVVHLAGEADLSAREQLDAAFAPLIGVPVAIVHVADLTSADTTLLNAVEKVVQARTERFGIDAPLRIVGALATIVRLFQLSRADTYVRFYPTINDASLEWMPVNFRRVRVGEYGNAVPRTTF